MAITLKIPADLYAQIQKDAIPFVDLTPIDVIRRWGEQSANPADVPRVAVEAAPEVLNEGRKLNPLFPQDLMHTRCRGSFGEVAFDKWNDLVRIAHIQAFKKAGTFEALQKATYAQIKEGNHDGVSGFHFVPEIGISIQGVDANHAWTYAFKLAKYLSSPIRVSVEWRHNEKAAFPGEKGVLEWLPA